LNGQTTTNASPAVRKRSRRIYILNTEKRDGGIYRVVAKYQFPTAEIIAEETGRDLKTVQKRLQSLYESGYLNRQRRDMVSPYIHFFSEKGAQEALTLGHLAELRFTKGKSKLRVDHDLEITYFHRALFKAFGDIEWEQWWNALGEEVHTMHGMTELVPDAYFVVNNQPGFLEIIKSYEDEYEGGISRTERKFEFYSRYRNQFRKKYGHDDFRVFWVLPTRQRVLNLLAKLEDKFPTRRFYLTDEASYKTNIKGKIWWTPLDFRDATYAIA
jgi:hypothetical protein